MELSEWLGERGVTHVGMESTCVYWKPIVNLLEGKFTVWEVNAHHIKAVPGRKTDIRDAEWIADLLRHGLLSPSFIPERSQRELRELVRYRQSLIQERSREANRVQKVLEGANIKLGSVATDVLGVSGRMMLTALAEGEEGPEVLAGMANGRLREKLDGLEEGLEGVMGSHQRLMLGAQMRHLSYLDMEIERLDAEVARRVGPHKDILEAVDTIPGVGRLTAETIVAEIVGLGGVGQGCLPHQDLPGCAVSPLGASHRSQQCRHGRCSQHRRHRPLHHQEHGAFRRPGIQLLREKGQGRHYPQGRPTARTVGS